MRDISIEGSRKCWRNEAAVIGVALGIIMLTTVLFAQLDTGNPNPGVLPPNSTPYGLTYGEWSARWWQFVFSIPAADNPLLQDDKCEVGQSGPVWFLTGKFCVNASCQTFLSATRHCTVPAGKALFFPIANSEFDNLGVAPPLTLSQLRDAVKASQDTVTNMTCEVDGVSIQGLDPPATSPYRVQSPVFSYRIPENNLYQFLGFPFGAQTVQPAVADGVFLMLAPLPGGEHTIHFTASFSFGFAFDITYHISVVPRSAS